jgi:peptidoglycan/LPS O-acetylase OafA/YrhL
MTTLSKGAGPTSTLEVMIVPAPATVRQAAVVVVLEGAALIAVAVVLVVRHLGGVEDQPWLSGYGTAAWFAVMGSAVLAAGWALWTGRRWGRGIAVFAQLLLLPVAYYMGPGSGQWAYAIPVGLVALATLALLFSRATLEWVSAQDSSASADNSGPDTR